MYSQSCIGIMCRPAQNYTVKSLVVSLKMKTPAQLYAIIPPDEKWFSHIHRKLFLARPFPSLPPVYSLKKANSLSHMPFLLQVVRIFPFSNSPNLSYRSVGLKVHLLQLANDLFWAVGKYLSQLVLVLKSLRDGAEGSAKSINLSEKGDMIYAGCAATPPEQGDLAPPWKDEYTLLKIS